MTTKRRDGSLSKTARLLFLFKLQEDGTLDSASKNELARRCGVSRFTIYRDLDDMKKLQPIYDQIMQEPLTSIPEMKGKQS